MTSDLTLHDSSVPCLCLSAFWNPFLHLPLPALRPGKCGRMCVVRGVSFPCSYVFGHVTSTPPVTGVCSNFGMIGRLVILGREKRCFGSDCISLRRVEVSFHSGIWAWLSSPRRVKCFCHGTDSQYFRCRIGSLCWKHLMIVVWKHSETSWELMSTGVFQQNFVSEQANGFNLALVWRVPGLACPVSLVAEPPVTFKKGLVYLPWR